MLVYCKKALGDDFIVEQTFDWLRNPKTNHNLYIDIYYPKFKLAIEIDGTQHYKYSSKFYKTIEDFKNDVIARINGGLNMTQYEELKSIISKQEKEIAALKAKLDKVDTYIYNYIDDNMPKWAQPTIKKLVDKGVLVGDDNGLNLNNIMMRILVILDRIGIFGE